MKVEVLTRLQTNIKQGIEPTIKACGHSCTLYKRIFKTAFVSVPWHWTKTRCFLLAVLKSSRLSLTHQWGEHSKEDLWCNQTEPHFDVIFLLPLFDSHWSISFCCQGGFCVVYDYAVFTIFTQVMLNYHLQIAKCMNAVNTDLWIGFLLSLTPAALPFKS